MFVFNKLASSVKTYEKILFVFIPYQRIGDEILNIMFCVLN